MKRSQFKGLYYVTNRDKYNGNGKVVYRSSWERLVMSYLDRNPNILQWSSESLAIPYQIGDKQRTYYPDLIVKMIDQNDNVVDKVIEIKPHYQKRWSINKAKWNACRQWCSENNHQFIVLTEKEIFNV